MFSSKNEGTKLCLIKFNKPAKISWREAATFSFVFPMTGTSKITKIIIVW